MMDVKLLVAGVAFLVLSMPVGSLAQDEGGMTPAENSTAAKSYQTEAKQAQEKVAEHERMLQRYRSFTISPKALNLPKGVMIKHCEKLIDGYKQVAAQAGELAKLHAEAAGGTQGK